MLGYLNIKQKTRSNSFPVLSVICLKTLFLLATHTLIGFGYIYMYLVDGTFTVILRLHKSFKTVDLKNFLHHIALFKIHVLKIAH